MGNWDVSKQNNDGEPSEDTISRRMELEIIKNLYPDMPVMDIMGARRKWLKKYKPYFECENAIEQLPSVTPKQRTGHWIYDRTRDWDGECKYECSCCGMGSDVDYAYCMRCGAKMVEPQERSGEE